MPRNPEANREHQRRWREANPEKHRERQRRYYRNNPDKAREKQARRYGLTLEEYDQIIARGCAICGTHEGRICIDHCHTTGKVRDALCDACNRGIGAMGDNLERVEKAAKYLKEHRA